ncbi:hypothetical protein HanPSC8_Chr02g0052041 [Helianthus annuus]|nr:hypothetical protein HanPSC8_Chr02g0052041 [Helianthus annuus]
MFAFRLCHDEFDLISIEINSVMESHEQYERLVLAPRCFRHRLGCDRFVSEP